MTSGLQIGSASGGGSAAPGSTSGRKALLAPFDPARISSVSGNLANFIMGCRVEAPISGTLHDLTVFVGTASGNLRVGVYDTGDASPGNRSRLYDSGSVVAAGALAYQVVGDPNIAVVAGKQYDLVVFPDNNTLTLGRIVEAGTGQNALPTNFLPAAGGASPKLAWGFSLAFAALPATITEAQAAVANASAVVWVGGRIS